MRATAQSRKRERAGRLALGTASARAHWLEYVCEATGPALALVAASIFAVLLEHPESALHQAIAWPWARRALMGLAMAGTALALIYGPIGRRSGAHFNPATTLAFWRLGRVAGVDAAGYIAAQFVGAAVGITAAAAILGQPLMRVAFVATRPSARGPAGVAAAFVAEFVMAAILMTIVLVVSNRPRINHLAGLCAAALVAIFITVEAPISGMSLNPARSLAPEIHAGLWRFLWVYFVAPPLGMLVAAEGYRRLARRHPVLCAKLWHAPRTPCPFRCSYPDAGIQESAAARRGSRESGKPSAGKACACASTLASAQERGPATTPRAPDS